MIAEREIRTSNNKSLTTDLYQLKMAVGFVEHGTNDEAVYELMFRKLSPDYGYFVANGIEQAIDYILNNEFTKEDLRYLASTGDFSEAQLDILRFTKFRGDIYTVPEGTPIGPNTPAMSFVGRRSEVQLAETIALCATKFPTKVASKASRIARAANGIPVADFGLRDMPSPEAAEIAARAAYIGGFAATSNVEAGRKFGIPITGTMAHAWVMQYGVSGERRAFKEYYQSFPDRASFLLDTWDVERGAMNAALVALEMEKEGHKLVSVRLDSGNLKVLSSKVRAILDSVGLDYVKILATNELDEYKLSDLNESEGEGDIRNQLNGAGVGHNVAVAGIADASFKLVEDGNGVWMKYAEGKMGIPGRKQVWRQVGVDGRYSHDEYGLWDEHRAGIPLLQLAVKGGKRIRDPRSLKEIREYSMAEVAKLPENVLLLPKGEPYQLVMTDQLLKVRAQRVEDIQSDIQDSDTYALFAEAQAERSVA